MKDMWERNPQPRKGEEHPQSKLTEQQVREIKERYEPGVISYEELAQDYPVSGVLIGQIIRGEKWSHVET